MGADKVVGIIVVGANGRMGQQLVRLAMSEPDLALMGAVDRKDSLPGLEAPGCFVGHSLSDAIAQAPGAVVVDFSTPGSSLASAEAAAQAGSPIVIGTTGFDEAQKEALAQYAQRTPLLWSANMSVGVNVLLRLLPQLAASLGSNYDIEMMEAHHRRKKDAPSGTALMLGEALAQARGWDLSHVRRSSRDGLTGERKEEEIGIQALRGGDIVGIHTIWFMGPGENIQVTHQAESRENFAQGALRAARWICDKAAGRIYSMQDVIRGDKAASAL